MVPQAPREGAPSAAPKMGLQGAHVSGVVVPAGSPLHQAILRQYYYPVNVDQLFGLIPSPKLEDIFGKSKPRYFKRTSSAVWHSPPESTCGLSCNVKL